jgi:putative DNA primase/helicase
MGVIIKNGHGGKSETAAEKLPGIVTLFPANQPADTVNLTEDDVAEAFAKEYGDNLRFDHDAGRWFVWNGSRWEMNRTRKAFDFCRHLCRKYRSGQQRMASENAAEGVERMASRDQRLAVTSEIWDRDPFLLGTPGGTVDLRTGVSKPASRDAYITKLTSVAPAPIGTAAPIFQKFLNEATGGDVDLQAFLQRWAGYCLTGDTSEQSLLFVYGPGGNGKGRFIAVLTEIMADYAKTATMEVFAASKHPRHLTELAMLHGARLVTASETERHQAWSESRINQLTGEDNITANFMRCDHFTFRPNFKLTLIGNHKPRLETVNEAARRRFNIVPFLHKPAEPDKTLLVKLRKEYPAILHWMIEGCLSWQNEGLKVPKVVMEATAEYFEEQDLLASWISENCELGADKKAMASKLYASFKDFATESGENPGSSTSFGSLLAQHGFQKKKTGGCNVYFGIQLKSVSTLNFSTDI